MNEIKDELREWATEAGAPKVDAAKLIRAARRRRVARRGAGTAVMVTATALAVATVPSIVTERGRADSPAGLPGSSSPVWADADTLHFGDVDVPRPDELDAMTYAEEADYVAVAGSRATSC
jgi:hypothetical protein